MNRRVTHLLVLLLGLGEIATAATSAVKTTDLPAKKTVAPVAYGGASTDQLPPAPIIRLNASAVEESVDGKANSFPFKDHHVNLSVSTGDTALGEDWLVQTRLDTDFGDWSAPAPPRSFEFTNLSEGSYRFEARVINSAGLTGAISHLAFTIQPPWYRAKWAYASYIMGALFVLLGISRMRDRHIRLRNQELKKLVAIRTEELIKASAAKDEFLAAISHEIRNPVNGIIGIAESIKSEGLDPDSRHKLGLLRQCSRHLSSLLEDVLDFSRFQPDAFKLDSKPFELAELMESITALVAAESEKCGIPVEIAISPAVPRQLTGDPRRIRQVLLNYISNALKYCDRGKISVTVWRDKTGEGLTEILFAVCDEGPGIPIDEQKALFTRFERSESAQVSSTPGTGLGLFICKAIAEKMGGKAWMKSEPGKGTCFYFSAIFPATEEGTRLSSSSSKLLSVSLKKALVVDDEEYNRIALTGLLESLGLTVFSAAENRAAIALAKSHDLDVIFLDYSIPGLDGPAIAREIRSLPGRSAQATLFATTAFNTQEKRVACLSAGMNGFITKPVTTERLRLALNATEKTQAVSSQQRPVPAEPLGNLRLLATKKGIPFVEELRLYLTELEAELKQLLLALQKEDSGRASYYAHLLYGRCAFINERSLESTLRQIEITAATERWDEARSLSDQAQNQATEFRLRVFSENPAVQHG